MAGDKFDDLFSNLRRGPWHNDPNGIPQEGFGGNGNVEAQGWLADDAVTADVIRASAVETDKLAANAVTAAKISAGAIETDKLAANAVTAAKVAANTITADEIAANTLTANEIAASAITATELAADSVTTTKIVAGNVTSSRIELTVSGKSFGAVDGSAGAPGVYFDADTDTGLVRLSATMSLIVDGGDAFIVGSTLNRSFNTLAPSADDTLDCGSTTNRWATVYRVAESAVSDARRKKDVADAPLGLDFIKRLKPRIFRWRDTPDTQARESVNVDEEALARECRPHVERIRRIREQQLEGAISDERAAAEIEEARANLSDIAERHTAPAKAAQQKRRAGKRLHYGLIAQEVKEALDAAGVDSKDAGFWQQAPDGEQSLSYSELTIPLLRAVQELAGENQALIARVEALEGALGWTEQRPA